MQETDGSLELNSHLKVIENLLSKLDWKPGAEQLGVAVTGMVSKKGDWTAGNVGTISGVSDSPLGDELRARFGNVNLMNDAASATLAEHCLGAGRGTDNFVYLTVSTGVGGGVIANGSLLESKRGLTGHFGFTTSRTADRTCGCGRFATFESVASGRAISQAATDFGMGKIDAKSVFGFAAAGEEWANVLVDRSAKAIAELVGNLVAVFDPECIAFGGSVGLASGYLERVQSHLAAEPVLFQAPIVKALLGPDGPLLGTLIDRSQSFHSRHIQRRHKE